MLTRKEREQWLNGRKVHGITEDGRSIACRTSWSLASGLAFHERHSREHYDLRQVTCKACRKALRRKTPKGKL